MLRINTWDELERHREQAIVAKEEAMESADAEVYRNAADLHRTVVAEMMRRRQNREEPDTERITL